MNKPLTRSEVAIETTWNLADLFATRDEWLAELAAVERSLESVVQHQGRLAAGPAVLLACLDARDALLGRMDRVNAFAGLHEAGDGGNAAHQADLSSAAALGARVRAALKFVDNEILALPEATLAAYLRDEPALSAYRPTLDDLAALRPHMLSPETERVLASLGEVLDAPHTIYSRAKTGDMQFAPFTDAAGTLHPNSFNLYQSTYEADADTSVRRAAWASFCAGLDGRTRTRWAEPSPRRSPRTSCSRRAARTTDSTGALPASARTRSHSSSTPTCSTSSRRSWRRTCAATPACAVAFSASTSCCTATSRRRSIPDYEPAVKLRGNGCDCSRRRSRRSAPSTCGSCGARSEQPLDRPRQQRRQGIGSVLRYALRRAFVHPDDLDRFDARRVHPRPRARPRRALHAGGAASTPRQHGSGHAVRRGAVDHERGAAGPSSPGHPGRRPAHAPLGADPGAGHLSPQLRHPPARGRAAAAGLSARRRRAAGHRGAP